MRENITEVPGGQTPPAGNQDFSMFLETYEKEKKKINNLEDRIMERLKFLEKEKDPQTRQLIKEEIEELREEKSQAREAAVEALNLHRGATAELENFDPESEGGNA